ncbi:transposase [Kaistella anthropi]|nr:transposase [Kaistella anthropi]
MNRKSSTNSVWRARSQDDFYRKISQEVPFSFLYKSTSHYYGRCGQDSIDPVVFFKILLVGYLNNLNSDRALLRFCSDSLSIRLFLGYDLDEELPWHSTISRARALFGEELFMKLFQKILSLCIEKGMVRGKRQAVDSAFIKANASMDSLVEKEVLEDASAFVEELEENSEYKVTSAKETCRTAPRLEGKRIQRHARSQQKRGQEGRGRQPAASQVPLQSYPLFSHGSGCQNLGKTGQSEAAQLCRTDSGGRQTSCYHGSLREHGRQQGQCNHARDYGTACWKAWNSTA